MKLKGNKTNIVLLCIIAILGITAIFYYFNLKSSVEEYENVIYPGVKIQGYDVGKLTKDEATLLLNEKFSKPLEKNFLTIEFKENKVNVPYTNIETKYNIDEVINKAIKYGKDKNIYAQYKLIQEPKGVEYNLSFTENKNKIDEVMSSLEKSLNKEAVNAKLTISNGNFNMTPHINKEEINKDEAIKEISKIINENRVNNATYKVKIIEKQPNITEEKLKSIDSIIASARTKISPGDEGRYKNIELCTNSHNGIIIMPEDTYSFNKLIGDTTSAKGYLPSKIIINGKLEDGVGGGICQVSTTLHNAVLKAGIIPTERRNHDMPVRYSNLGMDATIAFDYIDYKFKNSYKYPIYIQAYVENSEVVFNIYSNNKLKNRNYEFLQETYWEKPIEVTYKLDSNIPIGVETVENPGSVGYKVKTYRNIYENGVKIKSDLLYDDYYEPVNKVIIKNPLT